MVSVASLLNPVPPAIDDQCPLPSPCSIEHRSEGSPPPTQPHKKQKMSKDAAIFLKGKVQGEVRYPPCEFQDENAAAEHQRFCVYPMGQISQYHRHIPYSSEKKSFLEKTGRGAFEVFQYTFKVPPSDTSYTVMWDYNVGLVRITPFFKCCQYAKTMPAKMLNSNPGLREICHSITGGALAAQGYWMPFEAAKAVAATFCYHIRYALTPVFGLDFVEVCVRPGEEGFGHMVIDQAIVRKCREEALGYRAASCESSQVGSPVTPGSGSSGMKWTPRSLRPRLAGPFDSESGYYTDTDQSEKYLASPQSLPSWTSVNTPRSINDQSSQPSPQWVTKSGTPVRGCGAPPNSPNSSRSEDIGRLRGTGREVDEEFNASTSPPSPTVELELTRPSAAVSKDSRAAYLLMQLHFADASLNGSRKRRASS